MTSYTKAFFLNIKSSILSNVYLHTISHGAAWRLAAQDVNDKLNLSKKAEFFQHKEKGKKKSMKEPLKCENKRKRGITVNHIKIETLIKNLIFKRFE